MHPSALRHGELFFQVYGHAADQRILDVGSRDINGSLRSVAPVGMDYTGVDLSPGKGVDQVLADPAQLPFTDGHFDLVVSTSCLEHDPCFWMTVAEMTRVLRPGGRMYLNMPANGVYHGHPCDHWRFYPDAGPALVQWLQRLGWSVQLLEAFIAPACADDGWMDAVLVIARTPCLHPLPQSLLWQRVAGARFVRTGDRQEPLPASDPVIGLGPGPGGRLQTRPARSAIPAALLASVQTGTLAHSYRGLPCLKSPFDLALYSRLIDRLQPATIIELGSYAGGSALWFHDQLRVRNLPGRVVSIDQSPVPLTPLLREAGIDWLQADVLALAETLSPDWLASLPHPWLVVEDTAHHHDTCLAVLEFFHDWLLPGDVIVIEDGIVADLDPSEYGQYADGPNRAIERFFGSHEALYRLDTDLTDAYGHNVTWNTNGYWQRIA